MVQTNLKILYNNSMINSEQNTELRQYYTHTYLNQNNHLVWFQIILGWYDKVEVWLEQPY